MMRLNIELLFKDDGAVKHRFRDRRPFQDFMKNKQNYRTQQNDDFKSFREDKRRAHKEREQQQVSPKRSGLRSRSRSRTPERPRRRQRSGSPYSKAFEKWKKFKQSEKVMLGNLDRKREIYDKRPEDHPNYPEEWKIFWERRYKELQAEGRDADSHDYKSEWIPFWARRVNELFEDELKVKTQSLLLEFDLTNPAEPRRSDFNKPSKGHFNDFLAGGGDSDKSRQVC